MKELIEVRNAEINARTNRGRTALRVANRYDKPDIAAYLVSHGGIEFDPNEEDNDDEANVDND